MKGTWNERTQRLDSSGYSATIHDHLPWVSERTIPESSNSEIARVLIELGVQGAGHSLGRTANLELYAKHLDVIRKKAGDHAVAEFLAKGTA